MLRSVAMSVTVPYTFANGAIIEADELNDNFAAVVTYLQNLTTDNLNASAGIVATQLSENKGYFLVNFRIDAAQWAATSPFVTVGLPGFSDTFQIVKGSWRLTDCGANTTAIKIEWGSYTGASNAWANFITVVSTVTISGTGADRPQQGSLTINATSVSQHASIERALRLEVTTKDGSAFTAATDSLEVTLLLKHVVVS